MSIINQINDHISLRTQVTPPPKEEGWWISRKIRALFATPPSRGEYHDRLLGKSSTGISYDSGLSLDNEGSWLYRKIHSFLGRKLLPKSSNIAKNRKVVANLAVEEGHEWNYTPVTLLVGGKKMDAMVMTHTSTVLSEENPGDWVLGIFGRGNSFESRLSNRSKGEECGDIKFRQTVKELSSEGAYKSALLFNYADEEISKELAIKTTRAALRLLTKEDGLNAQSVDIYQYSFGGALGYRATVDEVNAGGGADLSKVKRMISDRTFTKLSDVFTGALGSIARFLIRKFDWEMDTESCLEKVPDYIEQLCIASSDENDEITHDQIIPKEASLASKAARPVLIEKKHSGYLDEGFIQKHFSCSNL